MLLDSREHPARKLSNSIMSEGPALKTPAFSISASAEKYLRSALLSLHPRAESRGTVMALTYSGGAAVEKDGKMLWQYQGPNFLVAGITAKNPRGGHYYGLLGFKVWIGEVEEALLDGLTLTTITYGESHPEELLVVENAPENFLARYYGKCGCDSGIEA